MAGFYARVTGLDRDDLLQEAWLGLISAYGRLDERVGSPRQFLIRHARWRLLTCVRRSRRVAALEAEADCPVADAQLAAAGLRLDLEAYTRELPQRQLNVLSCLASGMTWREAAAALSCSSPNVAYHVRRIRTALAALSD